MYQHVGITAPPPDRSFGARHPTASAFVIAVLGGFVLSGSRAAFSVQYPAMAADMGWSAAQVTGAYATGTPVYAASLVAAGLAVDRIGVRATMVTGFAILTVASVLATFTGSLWQAYLAWGIVLAVGQAGVGFVPVIKAIVTLAPARLGLALGLFQLGQGAGLFVVTPALALLADRFGWRGAQGLASIGLVAAVLLAMAVATSRRAAATAHRPAPAERGLPAGFWPLLAGVVGFGIWFLVPIHQVAHLANVGFAPADAAGLAGLTGVSGVIGGMLLGWLSGRLPMTPAIVLSAASMSLGTLALAAASPAQPLLAAAYVVGVGFGRGAMGVTLSWVEGRLLPAATLGRNSSLLEVGIAAGSLVGPLLAATWRDESGSYVAGLILGAIAAAVIGLGVLVSVAIATRAGTAGPLRERL